MIDPRTIAYNLIEEWEEKSTFPNLALKKALRNIPNDRDRRFITALVYGVVEKKITLDHFLAQCSQRSLDRLSAAVLSVLRMGVYQLFYMQIPASAACNTSVELIKKRGFAHSAGFVNAVLRCCDRERERLLMLKKADFSVRYSIHPSLVELLLDQYGKETFVSIMEGYQKPDTAIYLYFNQKRGSKKEFEALLLQEGISAMETDIPQLFKVDGGFSIENSETYRGGWCHVVGRHSAEAALLMPKNTKKVMDLCAAPGGKTFIMAACTEGAVFAFDIHAHKVENLRKSAHRLGHRNVVAIENDGTSLMDEHVDTADFVLCDVPCSGLGMMGKKPDIKYKEYVATDFTDVQYEILCNGAQYLKSGGRLVYSTCTIDRRENEQIIERFLKENSHFILDQTLIANGYQTYLPEAGADGFFIAVLTKGQTIEN